jgi:prepilin-type N-terminal cleavage/methylation domain-containing protein
LKLLNRHAFTLIELLVVIAIIAILAAIVMLAINPAEMMKKGRDSTRLSDMETVRKAIDLAVAEGASLSAGGPFNSADHGRDCGSGGGWVRGVDLCNYLSSLPADPTNSGTYQYQFQSDANGNYELRCHVESTSNYPEAQNDGGSDNTCSGSAPGGADCWYEVGTDPGLNLMD